MVGIEDLARVAGVDEAGRGPLAGPVVAAAVILTPCQEKDLLGLGLTDSKKLSPRRRELLFGRMTATGVRWRAQAASPWRIDGTDILRATLWAMSRSLMKLSPLFDRVIVDGTFPVPGIPFPQQAVPRADSEFSPVAAASVVAKVLRDRAMEGLDALYPQYGFRKHKGYPTEEHRRALAEYGLSPVHRRTFSWARPS